LRVAGEVGETRPFEDEGADGGEAVGGVAGAVIVEEEGVVRNAGGGVEGEL